MAVNAFGPSPGRLPGGHSGLPGLTVAQRPELTAHGLGLWVEPGEGQEIDPSVWARAARLVLERARILAPAAEIRVWSAAGEAGSGETVAAATAASPAEVSAAVEPVSLAGRRSQLAIDLAADTVLQDGVPVGFTGMEYKLLRYLVINCSRAIGREELQRFLESFDLPGAAFRSIDVYVGRVRRKLGPARHVICTVRGGGYQFVPGPRATVRGPAEYSI